MSYANRSDIEAQFGLGTVKKWADLEDDGVSASITARITVALTYADATVNDRLRNGPVSIPFTGTIPVTIVKIAAVFAGVWLYESRGVINWDAETGRSQHQYLFQKREAERTIQDIHAGIIKLDVTTAQTAPEVVIDSGD